MQSLTTECALSPENSLVMMPDCFREHLGWGVYCHRAVRRGLVMTPLVTDLCRSKHTKEEGVPEKPMIVSHSSNFPALKESAGSLP